MDNNAHSYTEGADYNPDNHPQPIAKTNLHDHYISYLDVTMALSKFLELHERKAQGETVTTKEWNAAIAGGKAALEKAN